VPYLQVDLDGKHKWKFVAQGCGVSEAIITKGFLDLWENCWREKTDLVSMLHLGCLFCAPGDLVAKVLIAYGFVAEADDGLYRVRGAEKYLKVSEARSRGGKKAAANGNLKRGKNPPAGAGRQLEVVSSSAPALTPNNPITHTPNKIDISVQQEPEPLSLLSPEEQERTDLVRKVIDHYIRAMAANGIAVRDTRKKRELVKKRLDEGISAETLMLAIDGLTWSDWHMGRDPKTKGATYTDLEYAIGSAERIEAMVQRVPMDRRVTA
jgi:hypothetical protein